MFEDLPLGPQWTLTPEDIRAVATDYGLRLHTDEPHSLGGAVNGVALARTTGGAVVIRVHRPWTTPARLAALHDLSGQLRTGGVPLPPLLRTRDGATWSRLADRLVEVSGYVAHNGAMGDQARAEETFAALARFHAALDRRAPGALPPAPYSSYATPETALAMLAETARDFAALRTDPAYPPAARARAEARAVLETLATARRGYRHALTRGLTHGDFGGDNLLFRDGAVAAILDLDFLDERERVYDLAYTLYWTIDRLGGPGHGLPATETIVGRVVPLVARYQREAARPLSPPELRALPFELARIPLYPIAEAGYLAATGSPPAPLAQTNRAARHLPLVRAVVADDDAIAGALSRAG